MKVDREEDLICDGQMVYPYSFVFLPKNIINKNIISKIYYIISYHHQTKIKNNFHLKSDTVICWTRSERQIESKLKI